MQLNEPKIRKAEFLPAEEAGDLTYPMLKKQKTVTVSLWVHPMNSLIQPLHKVQNYAAKPTLMAPRHHHSSPQKKVHWFPTAERVKCKCTGFPLQNAASANALASHCRTRQVQMHWLPIAERGKYKAACMYFKCYN